MFNYANQLTLCRIMLIPLLVLVFYLPTDWRFPLSAAVFGLAGITDWLDGHVARKYQLTTAFGAFLDPVADKLIVVTALILLLQDYAVTHPRSSILFAVAVVIIIGREITVSALREWMSVIGARAHVAVTFFGKWKTTLQIIGISLMLYHQPIFGMDLYPVGVALLFIAAALTIWSMLDYLRAAWPVMVRERDAER